MESQRVKPPSPLLAIWLAWLVGPASLGASFLFCLARPELCYDAPNLGLACLLVVTHLGTGLATLAMLMVRGEYRRVPEFWILFAYWVPLAGWLSPLVLAPGALHTGARFAQFCMFAAVAVVAAMPAAGLVRLLRWFRRRA